MRQQVAGPSTMYGCVELSVAMATRAAWTSAICHPGAHQVSMIATMSGWSVTNVVSYFHHIAHDSTLKIFFLKVSSLSIGHSETHSGLFLKSAMLWLFLWSLFQILEKNKLTKGSFHNISGKKSIYIGIFWKISRW